jgi:Ser/Thr protein kinase RdoA (MazF antagonist)
VSEIDVCDDAPHCFVHPDMVPSNAIELDDGRLAIVDWANSGRGPRLWSLGMTLFAGGARDLRLVDWIVTKYRRRGALEPEELARLDGAILARPLTIFSWEVAHGRKSLSEIPATLKYLRRISAEIGTAARDSFAAH